MSREETSLPIVSPTSSPRSAEHDDDLGFGHVPARVGADADRLSWPDRAPAGGILEEQLGPLGAVDERVQVLRRALLHAGVEASLVGHARAPDLGRLDGPREVVVDELVG